MNAPSHSWFSRHVFGWLIVLGAVGLTGCDSKSNGKSQSPAVPVALLQGELIQSPPMPPPLPPVTNAPTPPPIEAAAVSIPSTQPATPPAVPAVAQTLVLVPAPRSAKPSEIVQSADGFQTVGFDKLAAFSFEVNDEILQATVTNATQVAEKTTQQIPKTVMEFDQKRVSLKGFMLPLKVEGGKVTEMLIMRDQSMCCYGAVPKINEWVSVRMVGAGVKPIMDQAITMYGKLHVGEMRENGYLVGIYRMEGERIDGPAEN